MADKQGPTHVVVDGSNIATEGRSMPSMAQLEEAVGSFMEEHPDAQITVVVDATFAHRIDKSEVQRYEDGISNNELVAPPAGAVGRGDAFVLGIADKAGSVVLSNDSFQEFHGDYPWLFDDGRLIGGKPVPHVGWVWVERNPVRGPVSRKATRDAKGSRSASSRGSGRRGRSSGSSSKAASQPMPVPTGPPPGKATTPTGPEDGGAERVPDARRPAPKRGEPVNELLPFLDFVEQHRAGSRVSGVVDAYASHGAYCTIGDVRGYLPLRMMSDPPPRSAKQAVAIGETLDLVVISFAAARRSIDCALPAMAAQMLAEVGGVDESAGDDDAPETAEVAVEEPAETVEPSTTPPKKSPTKRPARKKSASKKTASKKSATKKSASKKTASKKSATKKTAAKKSESKKSPAK